MTWSTGAGLEGKGVVVTGAGGGIGREVAIAFASAGAQVALIDVKPEPIEALLPELEGTGHIARALDLRGPGRA